MKAEWGEKTFFPPGEKNNRREKMIKTGFKNEMKKKTA